MQDLWSRLNQTTRTAFHSRSPQYLLVSLCVYVCVHMCMYVCTCVCMCVQIYMCVFICVPKYLLCISVYGQNNAVSLNEIANQHMGAQTSFIHTICGALIHSLGMYPYYTWHAHITHTKPIITLINRSMQHTRICHLWYDRFLLPLIPTPGVQGPCSFVCSVRTWRERGSVNGIGSNDCELSSYLCSSLMYSSPMYSSPISLARHLSSPYNHINYTCKQRAHACMYAMFIDSLIQALILPTHTNTRMRVHTMITHTYQHTLRTSHANTRTHRHTFESNDQHVKAFLRSLQFIAWPYIPYYECNRLQTDTHSLTHPLTHSLTHTL